MSYFLTNLDFLLTFKNLNLGKAVDKFYEIIFHSFDLHIPKTRLKPNFTQEILWSNNGFRKLINSKKQAHKKFKLSKSHLDYLSFSALRKKCKSLSIRLHANFIIKIENNINTNIKSFWNYIQSLKSNKSNIPSIVHLGDRSAQNKKDSTNLFANFFSSVYEKHNTILNLDKFSHLRNFDLNLNSWYISESEILNMLDSINVKSGTGPDGIPPLFLKSCKLVLVKPLHYLFNLSLSEGNFPSIWKKSYISPIFKSGDKNNIKNYRPITKLSIIPKLFEAIITKNLTILLSKYICPSQHGFLPKHSISTNLLIYQNYLLQSYENNVQVDSIYTDFQKAFDKVNHTILLFKLKSFGFGGLLLNWITSYLTNRMQSVKLSCHISDEFKVSSEVPQGSHLGPLLFLIYINDLPQILDSSIKLLMFADDAKIYYAVKSNSDSKLLKDNLNKFLAWSEIDYLPLNISKCQIISFSRNKKIIHFNYMLKNTNLTRAHVIKDLGIHFKSDLSFTMNHNVIIKKAFKTLGFVNRNTQKFKNITCLKNLYCSLVRSSLEFGSLVWFQNLSTYNKEIENLQHKFLKRLAFVTNSPLTNES